MNVPAHPQQNAARPQAGIGVVVKPAPPEEPKTAAPHEAVAILPGAQQILFAAASPQRDEICVLAQTSSDTYGGTFFVVRLDSAQKQVEEVMGGMNLTGPEAPVWSPDGDTVYFVFDTEEYKHPQNAYDHGLFAWDRSDGKVTQISKDSIGGLALSPDGTLAGFWDYSAGDQLTVYNLQTNHVVRTWPGQVHSEDDLVYTDLAFTPDGRSLLARLYAPDENAVLRYDIDSGKTSPFAKNVQSLVPEADSLYLLQFIPVPFTNPEHPHKLTKWMPGNTEPATVLEDFHYDRLSGNRNNVWLIGESAEGYGRGAAIYNTKTGQIQTTGIGCGSAVVIPSGKILYIFGNELVADPSVCSGPLPKRD
ncbi:MAG: WD40 repeat domain-containing protein [Candidatus Acidiferrales bacterium]